LRQTYYISSNRHQRYVYPLVAPPTPERLEQDKKSIDEQFEKTFTLVEQLAKDTEALKAAEQARTERLDSALSELETTIHDLKSANRRREDDAQRVRDDVQNLKDSIPRAMNAQKELADNRLREVNAELKSLKTLISQRMNPTATSTSVSNYLRPSSGNATPTSTTPTATGAENAGVNGTSTAEKAKVEDVTASGTPSGRSSLLGNGASPAKASIPAWQLAMASKGSSSNAANGTDGGSSSSAQEASGSS
jgi:peroxin-14